MENPILALIPSGYKNGKVYSVLPVDGDGDFDFFRFGDATRVKENGLIEKIVGSNNPRLNWSGDCPSLLMEGTRTNRQLRSEEFNNALWLKTRTTVTANEDVSPEGTETADKLECNSSSSLGMRLRGSATITSGATVVLSVFAKRGNATYCNLALFNDSTADYSSIFFDLGKGASFTPQTTGSEITLIDNSIESFTNGWYRISITCETSGNTTVRPYIYGTTSNGNLTVTKGDYNYFWGAQLEEGNYLSSYIKTEGSTVTRALERKVKAQTDFNKNKGVVFLDVKPFAVASSDTLGNVINLRGGTYNLIQFSFKTSNLLQFYINEFPSAPIVNYDFNHNGGRIKLAVKWDSGSYKLFANGQLLNSYLDTNRLFSSLNIFQFQGNDDYLNFEGEIYNSQVFGNALTDAEIITLTTL
ncbi:hypothetical protein N9015_01195 [Akkermansiaceae bacterium]|nr:hypothetical protein [Akkermansiaceae bacterium]